MITKYDAVLALVPDVSFGVTPNGQIIWHEEPQQKPTEEQIQANLLNFKTQNRCEFCVKKETANLQKPIGEQVRI